MAEGTTNRRSLALRLALAGAFIVLLLGISFWLIRYYMIQPGQTLVIKEFAASVPKPGSPPVAIILGGRGDQPIFQGAVVDAQTHQPIARFTVTLGVRWQAEQPVNYSTYNTKSFRGGKYTQRLQGFGGNIDAYFVRVQADGHYAAESPPLKAGGVQDFSLEPGQDLHGRVLSADGKPVTQALVLVADPGIPESFSNGRSNGGQAALQTDGDGHFRIPPQRGEFAIGVACDEGYARVDQDQFAKSSDIRVTPWGGIEGTLLIRGKPAAKEQMNGSVSADSSPSVEFEFNTTTDAQGHFHFDRVAAGNARLYYYVKFATGQGSYYMEGRQLDDVTVTSGQTAHINAGVNGRSIAGRLLIPKQPASPADRRINGQIMSVMMVAPPQMPPEFFQPTTRPAQQRYNDFLNGPAGAAYRKAQAVQRFYQLHVAADGGFNVDDIAPGMYQLMVFYPQGGGMRMGLAQFVVPSGDSQQVLQLPDILMIQQNKGLAVGDLVPPLSTRTLDGRDMSLSDYRGKYLVAVFSGGEIDLMRLFLLKAAYAKFAGDHRLAMIGLSFAPPQPRTIQFMQENHVPWVNGVIAPQMTMAFTGSFPSVWLIGPDGKVIARDLEPIQINAAVAAALGK